MKLLDLASRYRNVLLLVAALGLGAMAAFGARGYISEQLAIERERLVPRKPMAQVVVARRDLPRGEVASADTMAVREVPAEYLSATVITPERFDGYAGARLVAPMRAGEPLLSGSLEGADAATFSAKVREGIRAITIAVDEVNSLSGMLQPGDRIDLLLSVRMPAGSSAPLAQEVTRPLMQDLRVLATGRQVRPGSDERNARAFTAITVEVAPVQAQKLVVAQRIGKLTAMLRNPRDREAIEPRPMDVYGLLGLQPAVAAPAAPAERPPEIIVGGQGSLKAQSAAAAALASNLTQGLGAIGAVPPAAPLAPSVATTATNAPVGRATTAQPVAPSPASSAASSDAVPATSSDAQSPNQAAMPPTPPAQPTWMLPPSRLLRPGAPR